MQGRSLGPGDKTCKHQSKGTPAERGTQEGDRPPTGRERCDCRERADEAREDIQDDHGLPLQRWFLFEVIRATATARLPSKAPVRHRSWDNEGGALAAPR